MLRTFLSVIGGLCILLFLFFVGVAVFSTSNKNETQNNAPNFTENSDSAAPAVLSVSAPKLYLDYQANEVQADNVYKGKRLAVRGVVTEIRKDFTENIVIALASTNEFETVDAHLVEGDSAKAADLQKWEVVNMTCDGGGMVVGSPQLENCELEAPNSNQSNPTPAAIQPDAEQAPTAQDSSETETGITTSPPTTPSTETNEGEPAPIVRQPPPNAHPQQ